MLPYKMKVLYYFNFSSYGSKLYVEYLMACKTLLFSAKRGVRRHVLIYAKYHVERK